MAPGAVDETYSVTVGCCRPKGVVAVSDKANAPIEAPRFDTGHETKSIDTARAALDAAKARFVARNPQSEALHLLATMSMPGGNTRTQLHTSPFPVCMRSGEGYQVTSEDGHTYTDLVGELTAGLYGHSHPVIVTSIVGTLGKVGMNLGATTAQEQSHASAMCARFGLDLVRFTTCGTEANLHALAGARAFTGRRKVVVFSGGYHGGVLTFAGGVPATNNVDRDDFIVAKYNDAASATQAIKREGVAAVVVEGMQGAPGAIPASQGFLRAVEMAAREAGVVFILDEVMTSRLAPGGLAEKYQLEPDLKTFGKYLGGGLAFGAFGGRADIMAVYDPRPYRHSQLTHHGTFNNNSLATHAGHAGLTRVYTPSACDAFNAAGERILARLREVTAGTKLCFTGIGTVWGSHFTDAGLQTLGRETDEDWTLKELLWLEMMEDGFWTTRRGSIALILGTPDGELERFVGSVAAFLGRHGNIVSVGTRQA